jgi:hypothetical protein
MNNHFIPEIQADDLAPLHIRQAMIAKLKSTPLCFEFGGKRQAFLSLRELTDHIELHASYYSNLLKGKALGRGDLDSEVERVGQWLALANTLLADVQSKLTNGIYKGVRHDH